ncbi:hypothetical protein VTL71DRAFT_9367 [Oculimacula yallundae]|uniref:Uncharacterized protein n=1 Tax=Oculimacula yallundae TaxID=86028 RepID=A0ABR4BU34_9HELO
MFVGGVVQKIRRCYCKYTLASIHEHPNERSSPVGKCPCLAIHKMKHETPSRRSSCLIVEHSHTYYPVLACLYINPSALALTNTSHCTTTVPSTQTTTTTLSLTTLRI